MSKKKITLKGQPTPTTGPLTTCTCGVWSTAPVHTATCPNDPGIVCGKCNNLPNLNRIELMFGDQELNSWVNDFYLFDKCTEAPSQTDLVTVTKIAYGSTAAYASACGDEITPYIKLTIEQRQELLLYTQLIMYHLIANTHGFNGNFSVLNVKGYSMSGPVKINYVRRVFYSVAAALLSEKIGLYKPNPKVIRGEEPQVASS